MSDFFQNGRVTTLHNLSTRTLDEMEKELKYFSNIRPMGLILPSLYSELERPALTTIVDEKKSRIFKSNCYRYRSSIT